MFRTEVICYRVMFVWSASNLLIRPWSTKSSPVLAAGRLIPSWGTVVAAGGWEIGWTNVELGTSAPGGVEYWQGVGMYLWNPEEL